MNRRPILGLMLASLLIPMLATRAAAAKQQVSTQAANSQPKPNDAVVHDFVFGDGENLASLKLHYPTLGKPRRDASGAITNGVLLLGAKPMTPMTCSMTSRVRLTMIRPQICT